jgi:acyl dehydratase
MVRDISFGDYPSLAGQELGVSDWLVIDQPLIDSFANTTGDHQWVHVDVARAEREIGGTIAHGLLTLSLMPQLIEGISRPTGVAFGLAYGFDRVRFLNKVRSGSRVRARQALLSADPKGDGLLVRCEVKIEVEGEERPAILAETLTLMYPER